MLFFHHLYVFAVSTTPKQPNKNGFESVSTQQVPYTYLVRVLHHFRSTNAWELIILWIPIVCMLIIRYLCFGIFYFTYIFSCWKALMKAIEHELEVIVRVHEVRSEYERQIQEYVSFTLSFLKICRWVFYSIYECKFEFWRLGCWKSYAFYIIKNLKI
jgi:hypothetical protein